MELKPTEEQLEELHGLKSDGDLCLVIACRKCNAMFELNHQAVAMAWITGASFMEYVSYVQSSKCSECNKD